MIFYLLINNQIGIYTLTRKLRIIKFYSTNAMDLMQRMPLQELIEVMKVKSISLIFQNLC